MELTFYTCALVALAAALRCVTHTNPVHSLLYLVVLLLAVAGIFFAIGAPFAGALEVIIYAGAIMVLFLFVVMLLNAPHEEPPLRTTIPVTIGGRPLRVGALLGVLFLAEMVWALSRLARQPIGGDERTAGLVSSVRQIGVELFTTHAFAFEVTSVLILVAMVGAVALAKRNL